jgi:hypothetical protein
MFGSTNRCGSMMGSYAVSGNLITLSLPLDFILAEGADPEVRFTGTFTATKSLVQQLTGDYNENGIVDAADYVVWRKNLDTTNTLPNDEIGGTIGPDHYSQWRANFGESLSGSALSSAVPEPMTWILALSGLWGLHFGRARNCR